MAAFLPRLVITLIWGENFVPDAQTDPFLLGALSALIIYILFYSLVIHRIVIKRINVLSEATQKVKDGEFDFVVMDSARDEIAQLTENFNAMTDGLKANEYLSRDFVKNFSHEFKTPLAVIKGYAELMDAKETTPQERKSYAVFIQEEVDRLSKMAQNVLEISRLEDRSQPIKKEPVKLNEMLNRIHDSLLIKAQKKSVTLTIQSNDLTLHSNKDLLYQALLNVIDNAVTFANEKSTVDVRIQTGDSPTIIITNQGPTIPKEDHDKIFQLFFTSHAQNHPTSTGIGLALVKKIMDRLGFDITFTSQDETTTFTLTL